MGKWTDEARDLLRTMWARGASSRSIAEAMPFEITRNACMGMVNRLGLMGLGHAGDWRLACIACVEEFFEEPFSLGSPLHRETLLSLVLRRCPREAEALALASGVCREDCAAFLARLPLVWPEDTGAPSRWAGEDGCFAFLLDMAVVKGVLSEIPVRGEPPRLAA